MSTKTIAISLVVVFVLFISLGQVASTAYSLASFQGNSNQEDRFIPYWLTAEKSTCFCLEGLKLGSKPEFNSSDLVCLTVLRYSWLCHDRKFVGYGIWDTYVRANLSHPLKIWVRIIPFYDQGTCSRPPLVYRFQISKNSKFIYEFNSNGINIYLNS